MKFRKTANRIAKKVGRAIKRRYFKGKGYRNPKLVTMSKDIMRLKALVNAEKKQFQINTATPFSVGQYVQSSATNANCACFCTEITPFPTSGTGYNQREGSSIKLHSSLMRFQLYQQSQTSSPIKISIQIIKVVGATQNISYSTAGGGSSTLPTGLINLYDVNPFIGAGTGTMGQIIDYNSQRNQDNFKDYVVLRKKNFTLKNDALGSQTIIKDIKIPMRYKNHHVRFDKNTTNITEGQLFLLILCDNGNTNSTNTGTLTGVPNTGVNTGAMVQYAITHYYYDN